MALSAFRKAAELNPDFAEAYFAIGWTLAETGRLQDALTIYDELLTRFDDPVELPLRQLVAKAFLNKGVGLAALGRDPGGRGQLSPRLVGSPRCPYRATS
jgi:tetratricopeptide (TPR) repeat protein